MTIIILLATLFLSVAGNNNPAGHPTCGESGGRTKKGKPCATPMAKGGRCPKHTDQRPDETRGAVNKSNIALLDSLIGYDEQFWTELDVNFVVAGTGSRSLQNAPAEHKKAVFDYLVSELKRLVDKYGRIAVISGYAEGFDSAIAMAAIHVRGMKGYEGKIVLIAALPSPDYKESYWSAPWKTSKGTQMGSITGADRTFHFDKMLAQANHVVYVCETHEYGGANRKRNQYMVDRGHGFYVYNPSSSGTKDCLKRIKQAGKPYIEVEV